MKPKEKMPGEVVEARNSRKRKSWSRSALLYVTKDKAFVDNEVRSLSELALKNQQELSSKKSKQPGLILPCGRTVPKKKLLNYNSFELWQAHLQKYLAQKGLKHSEQRIKIFNHVLDFERHFTTTELAQVVQKTDPDIGSATVYRTIALLLDAGLLRETLMDEAGQSYFELASEAHHDHIVCLDCQHIFEFHDEQIEHLQEQAAQKMNFRPIQHRHVVYARCQLKAKLATIK